MPVKYNKIRTLSFRLAPDIDTLPYQFSALSFPQTWKSILRHSLAEAEKRSVDRVNLPVVSLNKALRALVPDLISVAKKAGDAKEHRWLYSAQQINPAALHLIAHAWVKTAFSKLSEAQRRDVLTHLAVDDLVWQDKTVDLAAWGTNASGTTKSVHGENFDLLPDWIAARLSQAEVNFDLGSGPIRFRRAPLHNISNAAELLSWPPQTFVSRRQRWFFSLVATISLQTVAYQPYPVVHIDLGLRRWLSQPNSSVPGGKKTSIYLLTQVPWIKGLHQSHAFQAAPIRWRRNGAANASQQFHLAWDDDLLAILNTLHPRQAFPDPQALIADPEGGFALPGERSAAITFRNGMKPGHKVGPGIYPGDRRPLLEQIADLLAPTFVLTEAPTRVSYAIRLPRKPFLNKAKTAPSYAERRRLIAEATGGELTVEMRTDTEIVTEALTDVICRNLDLPQPDGECHTWRTPELTLHYQSHPLGALGDTLTPDSVIRKEEARHQAAVQARIETIRTTLPPAAGAVGSLVELSLGKDDYPAGEDPKGALRLGLARTNRLSQFILSGPDNIAHRAEAAFLDLLRQLGVQSGAPHIPLEGLPAPLNYVGLWLIKKPFFLPVFVHLRSDSAECRVLAPGLRQEASGPSLGVLPYSQALKAIAQGNVNGFDYWQKRQMTDFIRQTIEQDIVPLGDTLLLCHAQNTRTIWPWLANTRMTMDSLAFGWEQPQSITTWPGLRIVRIRDAGQHETPEWYAENEEAFGFSKGLFQMGERIFGSTVQKSDKFKYSPRLSKVSTWSLPGKGDRKPASRSPEAQKFAWNPALYELTAAALQPGDTPWQWAAVAHELRQFASHYDEPTAMPLPLHLAKLVKEYLPVSVEEDGDG